MNKTIYIICICLLTGCAGPYRTLKPSALNYLNRSSSEQKLEVSYLYDIQGMTRNKRYSKKEKKFGYATIGLEIKNLTNLPLTITKENFRILANGVEKPPILPEDYAKVVRQTSATYLLHTLWGPWSYSYVENPAPGQKSSEFKFYPIGAVIGIANLFIAENANSTHLKTLQQNSIYDKVIEPGATLYGIAIIPSFTFEPLTFEFSD